MKRLTTRLLAAASLMLVAALASGWSLADRVTAAQNSRSAPSSAARAILPRYDPHGALVRPRNFEKWIFIGASTGLVYEPGVVSPGAGEFHNVYITPQAYEAYKRTHKFPEKTILALALYDPSEKVSPAKGGYFEGHFAGLAVAVKDHSHLAEGWSYYNFGSAAHLLDAAPAAPKSACYDCHSKHGLDDNVFVQFYPVLRRIHDSHY